MVGNDYPNIPCRWKSYANYRLLVLMFMLNETSLVFTPTAISHGAFYIRAFVYITTVIFLGIPIIYSEICVAQYNNCTLISMWNFFPVFRGLGHGMIVVILLRIILLNVLTSWYLIYTFHAAVSPPPWFTCDYFNNSSKCMVKRENTSVFQYCLVAQKNKEECDYYTASYWFFDAEIRIYNTDESPYFCFYPWKSILACISTNLVIFTLSIKKNKFLLIGLKLAMLYISVVIFVLFWVALSVNGNWLAKRSALDWRGYSIHRCIMPMNNGFLSLGAGSGIMVHLSRDASFRSPATLTAVVTSLLGATACLLLALITFSGIKTMSYYHGQEDTIIEVCDSKYFQEFGSMSEILSYFDAQPIWAFLWFSGIFCCLCGNLWLLHDFLNEFVSRNIIFTKKYANSSRFILNTIMFILTLPFFCADLFESLTDALELIQLFTSFCFSFSLYWIYGFKKHSVDITFMIGIKIGIYWKIAWMLNPLFIILCICNKIIELSGDRFITNSCHVEPADTRTTCNFIMFYTLLGVYAVIVLGATIFELVTYKFPTFRSLVVPSARWGPKNKILMKSREMFMPSVMTTEFLYRNARIRGYDQRQKSLLRKNKEFQQKISEESFDEREWCAFTSN